MTDLRPTDDLDRALSALHADVETDPQRIDQTRAALLEALDQTPAAAPVRRPRRSRRWLIAAAAAVAIVAGVSVYATTTPGGSAEAKSELNGAAQQVTAQPDPTVPAGKYRYLVWRSWDQVFTEIPGGGLEYLAEHQTEEWVPADPRGTWYQRQTTTGAHQWIQGSDAEARKVGITFDRSSTTASAKCGAFPASSGYCSAAGNWGSPTSDWIAGLPKDPAAMYKRLKKDAPHNSRGDTELVVYAQDALRSGLLPSDVRATLYRALTHVDSLKISERAANLDGKIGIAYSSDDGSTRDEIVIDPKTGDYIGSREVQTSGDARGRVLSYSSFSTAVVGGAWKTSH